MNSLNISENIVRLRREKKVTQGELAEFVGVTKASVSKWETRQSLPDIMLLPGLASFFDVSIDELVGYEPQLSREQIQKIYRDLASGFAKETFEAVMEKSRGLVKKYYCCYPFLFQICVLWLNHFMLTESQTEQMEVLTEASDLCSHILSQCKDMGLCNDTILFRSVIDLQLGRTEAVIETLEEILNPCRLSGQSDGILIQAYRNAGKQEKADCFTQMSMYRHLLSLVSAGTQYLALHSDNLELCEETMQRIDEVLEAFHMDQLDANTAGLFHYQAATVYCMHGKEKEALERLKKYASDIVYLLTGDRLVQRGDRYFNRISGWFEQSDMGTDAPRDKNVIWGSAMQSLQNPAFSTLEGSREFEKIRIRLKKIWCAETIN